MITVFVYEYLSGGGLLTRSDRPALCSGRRRDHTPALPDSMLREGRAMLTALAEDFAKLPLCRVIAMRDATRLAPIPQGGQWTPVTDADEHHRTFDRLVSAADWTVLIAPETDGVLLELACQATRIGGALLSPSPSMIEIAANKQTTAERLQLAGVPCPAGCVWVPTQPMPPRLTWPCVSKPIDGAGSQSVQRNESATALQSAVSSQHGVSAWRLEPFVPGLAASVAVVAAAEGAVALPACGQRLSKSFAYGGGWLPLPADLDQRARALALRAVGALPQIVGWVGVDVVLGPTEADDRVIEVNPRLTTSYLGLRAATKANLAGLMLSGVDRRWVVELSFDGQPVEFDLAGTVGASREESGG